MQRNGEHQKGPTAKEINSGLEICKKKKKLTPGFREVLGGALSRKG